MPHIFVSYVRENFKIVERLCHVLQVYDIDVWYDRDQLNPGMTWAHEIRIGINSGSFFLACFSREYNERSKTYMNEELILAIEELRQRQTLKLI